MFDLLSGKITPHAWNFARAMHFNCLPLTTLMNVLKWGQCMTYTQQLLFQQPQLKNSKLSKINLMTSWETFGNMLVIFLEQSSRVITTGTEPLVFGDVWYLVPALIIITVILLLVIINQRNFEIYWIPKHTLWHICRDKRNEFHSFFVVKLECCFLLS